MVAPHFERAHSTSAMKSDAAASDAALRTTATRHMLVRRRTRCRRVWSPVIISQARLERDVVMSARAYGHLDLRARKATSGRDMCLGSDQARPCTMYYHETPPLV